MSTVQQAMTLDKKSLSLDKPQSALGWKMPSLNRILIYALLILVAIIWLAPLLVMVMTSLKTLNDIQVSSLFSLPQTLSTEAWDKAWNSACTGIRCEGVKGFFINSFIMVVPAVLISTFIGSINGYILALWRFKGSEILFSFILFGCFIPFQVIILPMAKTLGYLGLGQSIPGLIMVHVVYGICFTTMFFRNFYTSIPAELVKAARVDGASFFRIFQRIILPISGPIFMVSVIWQFTQIWNDFLFGVVFAGGESSPIMVGLNNLTNTTTGVKEYHVEMAAAMITALPTLLVYVLAGKFFVRGLTAGAVKG